jgi:hypothetical protein
MIITLSKIVNLEGDVIPDTSDSSILRQKQR